jgi:hypothetical protein
MRNHELQFVGLYAGRIDPCFNACGLRWFQCDFSGEINSALVFISRGSNMHRHSSKSSHKYWRVRPSTGRAQVLRADYEQARGMLRVWSRSPLGTVERENTWEVLLVTRAKGGAGIYSYLDGIRDHEHNSNHISTTEHREDLFAANKKQIKMLQAINHSEN